MNTKLPDYLIPIPLSENPKFVKNCDHDFEKIGNDSDCHSDCDSEKWQCKICGGTAWFEVLM